jgi:hypothetical protein
VTALSAVQPDGLGELSPTADAAVVEELIRRMSALYHVEPDDLRRRAVQILGEFREIRIRAFLPVLVEKRLREQLRLWQRNAGPAARE